MKIFIDPYTKPTVAEEILSTITKTVSIFFSKKQMNKDQNSGTVLAAIAITLFTAAVEIGKEAMKRLA